MRDMVIQTQIRRDVDAEQTNMAAGNGSTVGEYGTLSQHYWLLIEKKRTGQDRTVKKSQRRYISPIWGEAPTKPIFAKNCTVVAVPDVITCANF